MTSRWGLNTTRAWCGDLIRGFGVSPYIGPNLPALEPGSNAPIEWLENLVTDLGYGLTPREIEVCARALSEMTHAGIALDLGIKPTTVVTLVQRAYARVNISTLNELFGLCLASLSQQTGPD